MSPPERSQTTEYASVDQLDALEKRRRIREKAQQLMLEEIRSGRIKSVPPQPGMSRKDRRRLATMIRKSPRATET